MKKMLLKLMSLPVNPESLLLWFHYQPQIVSITITNWLLTNGHRRKPELALIPPLFGAVIKPECAADRARKDIHSHILLLPSGPPQKHPRRVYMSVLYSCHSASSAWGYICGFLSRKANIYRVVTPWFETFICLDGDIQGLTPLTISSIIDMRFTVFPRWLVAGHNDHLGVR